MLLSPSDLPAVLTDQMSTDLPEGKTIVDVFADFMRYLFHSTRALFKDTESNGELRWNSISESIELVLTHPNGWGGPQQAHLRNAAVKAGIVQDTPSGRSRVHFVTEGEASFSFCATHTREGKRLRVCHTFPAQCRLLTHSQPGEQALIIDAGGGTIDISTYKVLSNGPLRVEELYEPKCESDPSQFQVFPFDSIHFRFGPRRRACDSEGNDGGPRFVLTSHAQADCSIATREVEKFRIQRPRIPGNVFPEIRQWGKEGLSSFGSS